MVRVRLEGLPDEVQRIADAMQAAGCVLERSREYPARAGMSVSISTAICPRR